MNLPTEPPPNPGMAGEPGRRSRPVDPRYGVGYVHRPSRTVRHTCPLPAEWEVGAVWRCPEGHLWVVVDQRREARYGHRPLTQAWEPASWWERRAYGGKRATLDMANGNRTPGSPKTMPKGPSGISPSGRGVQRMRGIPPATLAPPLAPGVPPKDFDG